MERFLVVFLGGGTGSLVRFLVGTAIMSRYAGRFPLGTLAINISGSLLMGFVMTMITERADAHPYWRLGLVIGFLGGYTTFSSFEWETYIETRAGLGWMGFSYVLASVAAGYLAVWLGSYIAARS